MLNERLTLVHSQAVTARRKQGNMTALKRVATALDPRSYSLSALAALDMYEKTLYSGCIVTDIGLVEGIE